MRWDREELLGLALRVTVGALAFELAATTSFGVLGAALLATLVFAVATAWRRWGAHPLRAAGSLWHACGRFWMVPLLTLCYIGADLMGLFRSPLPERVFEKYKVVALMLFVSVCMLLYCTTTARLRSVLAALAAASAGIALVALLNGPWLKVFPVYYTLRLTLRRDYNVFATTLLLGYLCAVYLYASGKPTLRRGLWLAADTVLTLPVLYLSSSRRVYLMLPALAALWLCILLFSHWNGRRALATLGITLLCGVASWGILTVAQAYMQGQFQIYGSHGPTGTGGAGEGGAQDRYETVTESSLWTKRKLIWGEALEEYRSFGWADKLLGRGFGYNIQIYDETDNEALQQEYAHLEGQKGMLSAHNFVLADLLDGGLVKAGLGLALTAAVAAACLSLLRRAFPAAAFYGCTLGIVWLGSLISNRFGLLYDKFFYLFVLALLLECRFRKEEAPCEKL